MDSRRSCHFPQNQTMSSLTLFLEGGFMFRRICVSLFVSASSFSTPALGASQVVFECRNFSDERQNPFSIVATLPAGCFYNCIGTWNVQIPNDADGLFFKGGGTFAAAKSHDGLKLTGAAKDTQRSFEIPFALDLRTLGKNPIQWEDQSFENHGVVAQVGRFQLNCKYVDLTPEATARKLDVLKQQAIAQTASSREGIQVWNSITHDLARGEIFGRVSVSSVWYESYDGYEHVDVLASYNYVVRSDGSVVLKKIEAGF
jgi:hypothetical protein